MSSKVPPKNIATRSVRAGLESDAMHGSVVPPIYLSTNFAFESHGRPRQYDYTRSGNPTRDQLAGALADLEGGAGAVVTCTGMAAITLMLATLPNGARIIAPHDCYGGTYRLLAALHAKGQLCWSISSIKAIRVNCRIRWRPERSWCGSRPRAIRCCAWSIFAPSARPPTRVGALAVVDNTFLSPVWQQPLSLGADLVLHSTTKYLNGHSDVVGGAVIAATAELLQSLAWWANALGVTGAPFDSFLTLRGVRTLHARMRVHAENTAAIVDFLTRHPAVQRVYYPGLSGNPGHEIARRQQSCFGAMLSFELAGGEAAVGAFLEGLKCFTLAESLGGVESLIAHPVTMSHVGMEESARLRAGIGANLLRVSVGIEDHADLIADLAAGLERAAKVQPTPHLRRHVS